MAEQKKRLTTEEYLAEKITNATNRKNMIDFIDWLKLNKLSVKKANPTKWVASHGKKQVCYLQLSNEDWTIIPRGQYYAAFFDGDVLCAYIWESINPCNIQKGWQKCSSKCGGITRTVCGKEFDDTCASIPLYFKNPSAEQLRVIERVIEESGA